MAAAVFLLNFPLVIIELINTGSELMLGQTQNSHEQWLGRRLADLGLPLTRQVAVPDTSDGIETAMREALARADLVLTTGGLGPTAGDLTRILAARLLGRELRENAAELARINGFFAARGRFPPERAHLQALVPEGALVLANEYGTAPGLALQIQPNPFRANAGRSWLILLPGPPRELRPMFEHFVEPLLRREFPASAPFVCRILRSTGMGESAVEQELAPALAPLVAEGLQLGYCARPGEVDIRLAVQGADAAEKVERAAGVVLEKLGLSIYGAGDEELEEVVVRGLAARGQTLALAESCTGGGLANRITNVSGASAVLLAGFVTYSNAAKEKCLGVSPDTLARQGAVSEAVAREMAEGARRISGADYALAITGIAGPTGATPGKPVGTVFIALATPAGTTVRRQLNAWDRLTFKQVTCQQALELLRRAALPAPG